MIGKTISHYRIVSQLGAGGMGVVYAAEDHRLGRSVALKFVPDDLAKDQKIVQRLRSEARTASGLNHANICTVYDVDEYEGRPFIVMELLKGQTLRERLVAGPLRIHEVLDIGIQVAGALDWAHTNGIIHRDIKPANLLLVDRGPIKIVDFGLAKLLPRQSDAGATGGTVTDLTVAGSALGTVAYMSPEQVAGEDLDGRTDVFSLGVVLYESVTGRQPFTGKTSAVVLSAILNQTPVPAGMFNAELPLRLQEVIANCMEKDRELRYQNAAGLRADLKRIKRDVESGHSGVMRAAGLDTQASPTVTSTSVPVPGAPPDSRRLQIRNLESAGVHRPAFSTPVAVLAVIGLALAGSTTYLLWRRAPEATVSRGVGSPETLIQSRVESATASLRAKDNRTALSQSEEVLQSAPNQADAIRIRDEARRLIARFDEAVATATAMLSAGNADAAKAAIETARAIDPAAPVVNELSARFVSQFASRSEAARKASPPQSPPARAIPPQPRAATDAARPESQQPPVPVDPPPPAPPFAAQPPPQAAVPAPSVAQSNPGTQTATTSPPPAPPAPMVLPRLVQPEPSPPAREPAAQSTAPSARRETAAPQPGIDSDDAAIRRVVETYVRAIETKDLPLFRSIKPNMSPEEQRRLEEGFRAVSSQHVTIVILAINRREQEASVRLKRTDTIDAGGRQQTIDTQQTMTMIRSGTAWIIREIGR